MQASNSESAFCGISLNKLDEAFAEHATCNIYIVLSFYWDFPFLGHLSHSGDLLLWVGVRRRASCDVRRPSSVVR